METKHWTDAFSDMDPDDRTAIDMIVKIIVARKDRDWSQRRLSQESGVPQATIGRIETSFSVPRLDTLIKLCRALDLEVVISTKKDSKSNMVDKTKLAHWIKEEAWGCEHRGEAERATAMKELFSKIDRGLFDLK